MLGDIFFFLWSPYIGDQKDQYFFRDIFFFLCSPCMGMQKYQWGTHFFFCEVIVWDIFFKSIFCKSASRTLRSLRWDNWVSCALSFHVIITFKQQWLRPCVLSIVFIRPFYPWIKSFNRWMKPFHGWIKPFYRRIKLFYRWIKPIYQWIKLFIHG